LAGWAGFSLHQPLLLIFPKHSQHFFLSFFHFIQSQPPNFIYEFDSESGSQQTGFSQARKISACLENLSSFTEKKKEIRVDAARAHVTL